MAINKNINIISSLSFHFGSLNGMLTIGFDTAYPLFDVQYKLTKHINTVLKTSITILKVDFEIFLVSYL